MSFKFQPILNLRKHHEDNCRTRFKAELTKLQQIDEELLVLKETKQQQEAETAKLAVGAIRPEFLLSGSKYLAYLRQKQDETKARRVRQSEAVEQARETLVQARKEKKVMEKLKEKYASEEAAERLRLEQKNLDEVAINQYYRN